MGEGGGGLSLRRTVSVWQAVAARRGWEGGQDGEGVCETERERERETGEPTAGTTRTSTAHPQAGSVHHQAGGGALYSAKQKNTKAASNTAVNVAL